MTISPTITDLPDGTGPRLRSPFADTLSAVENHVVAARMDNRRSTEQRIGNATWEHRLTKAYAEAITETEPERLRAALVAVFNEVACWVAAIDARADQ